MTVFTPMRRPRLSRSGPPLFPGGHGADMHGQALALGRRGLWMGRAVDGPPGRGLWMGRHGRSKVGAFWVQVPGLMAASVCTTSRMVVPVMERMSRPTPDTIPWRTRRTRTRIHLTSTAPVLVTVNQNRLLFLSEGFRGCARGAPG